MTNDETWFHAQARALGQARAWLAEDQTEPVPYPAETVITLDYTQTVFLISEIDVIIAMAKADLPPNLSALRDRLVAFVRTNPKGAAWLDRHDQRLAEHG